METLIRAINCFRVDYYTHVYFFTECDFIVPTDETKISLSRIHYRARNRV